jgi:hypothetical protein
MKRICLVALLATIALSSSGCCLFDRLFCCPRGYPIGPGPCGPGCGPACGPCGGSDGGPACGSWNNGPRAPTCCDCGDCTSAGPPPGYGGPQGYCGGPSGYGGQPIGGQGRPLCANNYVPANSGPPSGAVAYPYYTTRGPRDFLANNPGSIGP